MKPFTIQCTTCQAKLKVRDESAVGQILACPKCGSMVLVEAPAPISGSAHHLAPPPVEPQPPVSSAESLPSSPHKVAAPDETIVDEALYDSFMKEASGLGQETTSAAQPVGEIVPTGDSGATPEVQQISGPASAGIVDEPPVSGLPLDADAVAFASDSEVVPFDDSLTDMAPPPFVEAEAELPVAEAIEPSDETAGSPNETLPPPPSADWTSASTREWRQWLALGGAAVGGIALAIGLFVFFITRNREEPTVVANAVSLPTDPSTATANENANTGSDEPSQNDVEAASDIAPAKTGDEPTAGADTKPSDAEVADATNALTNQEPNPEAIPDPIEPVAQASDPLMNKPKPTADNSNKPQPEQLATNDAPPGFQSNPPNEAAKPDAGDASPATNRLPQAIGQVTPSIDFSALTEVAVARTPLINDGSGDNTSIQSEPNGDEGTAADETSAEPSEATSTMPQPVNVAARLADPVSGVRFEPTPLADFLQFVTDFSTIPITLQIDSLARVGKSAETPVSVKLTNTNVAGMLAAALEPHGLGFEVSDGHLLIQANDESAVAARQAFRVADLASDSGELSALADLIRRLIRPESWGQNRVALELEPRRKEIVVTHDTAARHEIVVLLDRLRGARGIKPSTDAAYGVDVLSAREQLRRKLNTNVMANFARPTRITDILNYLGEKAELRFVVDWQSLGQLGWTPATQTSVVIQNESLEAGLTRLLTDLDLAMLPIDEHTIRITSREAADARCLIVFHGSKRPADSEATERRLSELRESLGADLFEPPLNATLAYAPSCDFLIARLPATKQFELATTLSGGT